MRKKSAIDLSVHMLIENADKRNRNQTIDALAALGKPAAKSIFNAIDGAWGLKKEMLIRALARIDIEMAMSDINWLTDVSTEPRNILVGISLTRKHKLLKFSKNLFDIVSNYDVHPRLRLMAVDALGALDHHLAVAWLFELPYGQLDYDTKSRVMQRIDTFLPITFNEIRDGFASDSEKERNAMAMRMANFGPKAVPFLKYFIQDYGAARAREAAQKSLESITDPAAIPAIVELLANSSNSLTISSAIKTLNRFGDQAIPLLREHFNINLDCALSTLAAYSKMDTPLATAEIIKALKIDFFNVRQTAIEALCKKGKKTIHLVVRALDDEYEATSRAALEGLCNNGYAQIALMHLRKKARENVSKRNEYAELIGQASAMHLIYMRDHPEKANTTCINFDSFGLKRFPIRNQRMPLQMGLTPPKKQVLLR